MLYASIISYEGKNLYKLKINKFKFTFVQFFFDNLHQEEHLFHQKYRRVLGHISTMQISELLL